MSKPCAKCLITPTLNGKFKFCQPCDAELKEKCKHSECLYKNPRKNQTCDYKRSVENKYCKIHQTDVFIDDTIQSGKRLCTGYERGCRAQLDPDFPTMKCTDCLTESREKEQKEREVKQQTLQHMDEATGNTLCSNCFKYWPAAHFAGAKGTAVKRCTACREQGKKADLARDKENRNAKDRIAAKKPARLMTKQEWAQQNMDKVRLKDQKHKAKVALQNDPEVAEKNKKRASEFRANNPDKVLAANENKKASHDEAFKTYKRSAASKNLAFDFSAEEYKALTVLPCHYCNLTPPEGKGFHGIDRIICTAGYTKDNAVSCCTLCNQMKASLGQSVFVKRVQHMCSHLGLSDDGTRWPEVFPDSKGATLKGLEERAKKKAIPCDLTPVTFEELHKTGCYMCGKQNTEKHRNGTDRVINDLGYVEGNVRACCGECNYMKKDVDLEVLKQKLQQICEFQRTIPVTSSTDEEQVFTKSIHKHLHKVTPEEKQRNKEEKQKARLAKLAEQWPELVPKPSL